MGNVLSILTFGLVGGGSKPSAPSAPPSPPSAPNPAKSQTAAEADVRRRKGATSKTIYSSPLGTAGEANVARKTLLGQ